MTENSEDRWLDTGAALDAVKQDLIAREGHHPEVADAIAESWLQEVKQAAAMEVFDALIKKWPTVTRDMVSRGQVRDWLIAQRDERVAEPLPAEGAGQ